MAPRKSDVAASNAALTTSAITQQELLMEGIENYELPKALVTRIAKSALPEQAKLQKEVVLALNKASTVFINYLAAAAHDVAKSRSHKNIAATDILKALEIIEFADQVTLLEDELEAFRGGAKKPKIVQKKKAPTDKAKPVTEKGKGKVPEVDVDEDDNPEVARMAALFKSGMRPGYVPPEYVSDRSSDWVVDSDDDDDDDDPEEDTEEEADAPAPAPAAADEEDRMSLGVSSADERVPRGPTSDSEAED